MSSIDRPGFNPLQQFQDLRKEVSKLFSNVPNPFQNKEDRPSKVQGTIPRPTWPADQHSQASRSSIEGMRTIASTQRAKHTKTSSAVIKGKGNSIEGSQIKTRTEKEIKLIKQLQENEQDLNRKLLEYNFAISLRGTTKDHALNTTRDEIEKELTIVEGKLRELGVKTESEKNNSPTESIKKEMNEDSTIVTKESSPTIIKSEEDNNNVLDETPDEREKLTLDDLSEYRKIADQIINEMNEDSTIVIKESSPTIEEPKAKTHTEKESELEALSREIDADSALLDKYKEIMDAELRLTTTHSVSTNSIKQFINKIVRIKEENNIKYEGLNDLRNQITLLTENLERKKNMR